jgi:hypothetical protein
VPSSDLHEHNFGMYAMNKKPRESISSDTVHPEHSSEIAQKITKMTRAVRIQYKCLIWNLIYSQTKYVIDYKDYLFTFMICNFPNWKFVCRSFMDVAT